MSKEVREKRIWCRGAAVFVLAFALLLLADDLASVSRAVSAGEVTADAANIRKEPSTSSAAVGSTVKKNKIEILGQTTGNDGKVWYQIYVNGTDTGFIRSDLVKITDGSTPPSIDASKTTPAPETPDTSAGSGDVEMVTPVGGKVSGSNTVRVRTSASTANNNNILTSLNSGTDVTVVGRTTGADKMIWYQIKFTTDGKEAIGYIRSDYLKLSGELKPLGVGGAEPQIPEQTETPEPADGNQPAEPEKNKRYETKLMGEKWYILDYQAGQQYEIEKLFSTTEEYKERYEEADAKARFRGVWMCIFGFLAIGLFVCAAYLIYRLKECKEEAFIASIENNTISSRDRTAERPRTENRRPSGEKPVIREGMGAQRTEGQRPQGQRPAGSQGQRPAGPQGQNPAQRADGQRPTGPQGQRPAGPQGQRPTGSQGQRPAGAQGQRPAGPQGQRNANPLSQRPSNPQSSQRVNPAQERPKSKNFIEDDSDFEVLNWDGDEE